MHSIKIKRSIVLVGLMIAGVGVWGGLKVGDLPYQLVVTQDDSPNINLEVKVQDYDSESVPVNTLVRLEFEFKADQDLPADSRYCIEFPINRQGLYRQDKRMLWSNLNLNRPDSPGYIKVRASNQQSWQEEILTNGMGYTTYCAQLKTGSIKASQPVIVDYYGYSQNLIRPLRFRALFEVVDKPETRKVLRADNVLKFKPDSLFSFRVKIPFDIKLGEPFKLEITAVDKYGNQKTDYQGRVYLSSEIKIDNLPDWIEFTPSDLGYKKVEGLRVNQTGFIRIMVESKAVGLRLYSNYAYADPEPSAYRFMGDTHFHTGYGLVDDWLKVVGDHIGNYGYGDPLSDKDYAYDYAKWVSQLDFVINTEHVGSGPDFGYHIPESFLKTMRRADQYYQPGSFTTFYGYEWGG